MFFPTKFKLLLVWPSSTTHGFSSGPYEHCNWPSLMVYSIAAVLNHKKASTEQLKHPIVI